MQNFLEMGLFIYHSVTKYSNMSKHVMMLQCHHTSTVTVCYVIALRVRVRVRVRSSNETGKAFSTQGYYSRPPEKRKGYRDN